MWTFEPDKPQSILMEALAKQNGVDVDTYFTQCVTSMLAQLHVTHTSANEDDIIAQARECVTQGGTFTVSTDPDTGMVVGECQLK